MEFITDMVRKMSLTEGENIEQDRRTQLAVNENNMAVLENVPVVYREFNMIPEIEGEEKQRNKREVKFIEKV